MGTFITSSMRSQFFFKENGVSFSGEFNGSVLPILRFIRLAVRQTLTEQISDSNLVQSSDELMAKVFYIITKKEFRMYYYLGYITNKYT